MLNQLLSRTSKNYLSSAHWAQNHSVIIPLSKLVESPAVSPITMDVKKNLSISAPLVVENKFVPKHYVQYLKYQKETLTFQSNLFYSHGPKLGLNKAYQLLTNLSDNVRQMLNEVEKFAIENLELPPSIAEQWQEYAEAHADVEPYKRMYDGPNIYIKLAHNVELYDMDNFDKGQYQPFTSNPPLGEGMYMVLCEIPGVYIGSHNSNPKVASLQIRITQVVYRPKVLGQCHIVPHLDAIKGFNNTDMNAAIENLFDVNISDQSDGATPKTPRKRTTCKKKKGSDNLQNVIDSIASAS